METDFTLTFRSDPALLCAVRRLVRQYVEDRRVSAEKANEVVLAVDEACTNAIRHAYGNAHDRVLTLSVIADADWIEIRVEDDGMTAPAWAVARKDAATPDLETLSPGGLGVQLIYEAFDDVSFLAAEPQGNCVVMRLRRRAMVEG